MSEKRNNMHVLKLKEAQCASLFVADHITIFALAKLEFGIIFVVLLLRLFVFPCGIAF